jgi:23S rRNA (adenine2503-C2)-methyltransferase
MAPAVASISPPKVSLRLPGILETREADLVAWLEAHGEKRLRAKQIRQWILERGADSFDQMTDLPRPLRADLAEAFVPLASQVFRHLHASDGTHKLLLEMAGGSQVECVLIQEDDRRTACISTQVGCGMGCVFCASGIDGVERNLSVGEILEQLVRLRALSASRLTHIVVMGMGEPLANLDNLLQALEIATAPDGLGIGARHVTISTVGLPTKIRQLGELGKQYHLAVSLHAPTDALRTRIVPTNKKVGLPAILEAADAYQSATGRQVTYEYVLLGGLNDDVSHARELARLLHGHKAHVNVIPFNDVQGLPYRRPSGEAVSTFCDVLRRQGVSVKVRKRKGSEIDAACGQLRRASRTPSRTDA